MRKSAILWLVMLISVALFGTTYDVPGDFATIQAALDACATGDIVQVAAGVYHENLVWPQIDGIQLHGSGSQSTIVDGSANGRVLGFLGNWQNPVITSATKVFDVAFRNGYGSMNGVGVCCNYASPEFYDCIISHNIVPDWGMGSGGGVYCYASNAHFDNVYIVNNKAYSGGGVHIDPNSSPVFIQCVIADNTLMSPGGSYAAGIYTRYQVYPQFTQCIIIRNTYFDNAAIHMGEVSNPVFNNCIIDDNKVGFRFVSDATATINQCTITENTLGGIVNAGSGNPNAENSWWGSATGPTHSANPGGTGELITGNVSYTPWLSSASSLTPPTSPKNLTAQWPYGASGWDIHLEWDACPEDSLTYFVHYGIDSLAVAQANYVETTGTSVTIPSLQPWSWHYMQVRAVRSNGIGGWFSFTLPIYVGEVGVSDPLNVPAPQITAVYPNPFSGNANLSYRLSQPGESQLSIYNLKGQLVRSFPAQQQSSGEHYASWNGCDSTGKKVPTGVYLAKLVSNGRQSTTRLMLIR